MTGNSAGANIYTTTALGCYDVCRLERGEVIKSDYRQNWQAFLRGFVTEEIAPGFRCFFSHDENENFTEVIREGYLMPPGTYTPEPGVEYA